MLLLTSSVAEKKRCEHQQSVEGNDLSRSAKKEFHFVSPFCSRLSAFLWLSLFCPRVASMFSTRRFVHHGLQVCFFFCACTHTHMQNQMRLVFFLESNKVKTGLKSTSKQLSVFGKCKVKSYNSVEFQMQLTHDVVRAALVNWLWLPQRPHPLQWYVMWVTHTHKQMLPAGPSFTAKG